MARHSVLGVLTALSLLVGSAGIVRAQEAPPTPPPAGLAPPAEAMRFNLTGGRVVEGVRVAEDLEFFTVQSPADGLVRIRKTDVATLTLATRASEDADDDDDDFVDEVASRSPARRHHQPHKRHHRIRRHHQSRPDPYDDEQFVDEVASLPAPSHGPSLGGDVDSNAVGAVAIGAELVGRGLLTVVVALVSGGQH